MDAFCVGVMQSLVLPLGALYSLGVEEGTRLPVWGREVLAAGTVQAGRAERRDG